MDTLIVLGMWLFILAFAAVGIWAIWYYIRMKVRQYKALAAEVKTLFKKDKQ